MPSTARDSFAGRRSSHALSIDFDHPKVNRVYYNATHSMMRHVEDMRSLVLTIIGPDRPGLVESVAGVVAEHGGSWVESRMSRLAGQFAGILRVSVPSHKADALFEACRQLEADGLRLLLERGQDEVPVPERRVVSLSLVGGDRPGIIAKISEVLAARNVNVEELNTECEGAPWSGDTLFKATARLNVPSDLDLNSLRSSLEEIGNDFMVDIALEVVR